MLNFQICKETLKFTIFYVQIVELGCYWYRMLEGIATTFHYSASFHLYSPIMKNNLFISGFLFSVDMTSFLSDIFSTSELEFDEDYPSDIWTLVSEICLCVVCCMPHAVGPDPLHLWVFIIICQVFRVWK